MEAVTRDKNAKKYKCTHERCNARFNRPSKLEVHLRKHTGERPYICNECNKSYTNDSHLRRHKKTNHSEKKSEQIRCSYEGCSKYLANKYSYKKHIQCYHNTSKNKRECDICKKGFSKKSTLTAHMFEHTGTSSHKCESCKIMFINEVQYRRHKINHKTYECTCKEIFDRWSTLLKHKKICKACIKIYKCDSCNKSFKNKSNLKNHLENHNHDDKNFKCTEDGCTRSYKYKNNLNDHIKYYHLKVEKKKTRCPHSDCGKEVQRLEQHLSLCHNEKNIKKARAKRKDEGAIKRSTALLLSGVKTDYDTEKKIIKGEEVEVEFNGETFKTSKINYSDSEESDFSIPYADDSDDESLKLFDDEPRESFSVEPKESIFDESKENLCDVPQENLCDKPKENLCDVPQGSLCDKPRESLCNEQQESLRDKPRESHCSKPQESLSNETKKSVYDIPEEIVLKRLKFRSKKRIVKKPDKINQSSGNDGKTFDSIFNAMLENIEQTDLIEGSNDKSDLKLSAISEISVSTNLLLNDNCLEQVSKTIELETYC